jgi:hypothetical protein
MLALQTPHKYNLCHTKTFRLLSDQWANQAVYNIELSKYYAKTSKNDFNHKLRQVLILKKNNINH